MRKKLKQTEIIIWQQIRQFLDPLKHNWINLGIYPSCYLVKLIKSRLIQLNNHIK